MERSASTSGSGSETFTLDASGSADPDGDPLAFVWRAGRDLALPALGRDPTLTATQAPGSSVEYSLRIWDDDFQMSEALATVGVVDTQGPDFDRVELATDCLWPPDHSLRLFRFGEEILVDASDACDPSPSVRIVEVRSDQPEDATGDGSTAPDVLFGDTAFCLRGERRGDSPSNRPRTYTVVLQATDAAGNVTTREVEIRVPHDQRPSDRCTTGGLAPAVPDDDPRCTATAASTASTTSHATSAGSSAPAAPPSAAACAVQPGRWGSGTHTAWALALLGLAALGASRRRRRGFHVR